MWRLSKKVAIYKSRREVTRRNQSCPLLDLNFQLPELWENKLLLYLFNHSVPGILLWHPQLRYISYIWITCVYIYVYICIYNPVNKQKKWSIDQLIQIHSWLPVNLFCLNIIPWPTFQNNMCILFSVIFCVRSLPASSPPLFHVSLQTHWTTDAQCNLSKTQSLVQNILSNFSCLMFTQLWNSYRMLVSALYYVGT